MPIGALCIECAERPSRSEPAVGCPLVGDDPRKGGGGCRSVQQKHETMQLKQFLGSDEDRAVSPVIGVVLMLTATVIIGGVVASFVTGMGSGMESAPQASFNFDYDEGESNMTITHEGGESIAVDQLEVKINGTAAEDVSYVPDESSVSTGSEIEVDNVYENSTVRLVWTDSTGDKTTPLGKWVGPDA